MLEDAPPRSWVLAMPPGGLLNSNDRDGHWARRHEATAGMRAAAMTVARAAKVPHHARRGVPPSGVPMDRARVVAVFHPPTHQRRDAANLYPAVKAYVDGLVGGGRLPGYGMLPDDDTWHLLGPFMFTGSLAVPARRGLPALAWVELRVTELPPLAYLPCVSVKAAAAVAAGAVAMVPAGPDADLEHRARADGKTVILMYTDEAYLTGVTAWAQSSGRLTDSVTR